MVAPAPIVPVVQDPPSVPINYRLSFLIPSIENPLSPLSPTHPVGTNTTQTEALIAGIQKLVAAQQDMSEQMMKHEATMSQQNQE